MHACVEEVARLGLNPKPRLGPNPKLRVGLYPKPRVGLNPKSSLGLNPKPRVGPNSKPRVVLCPNRHRAVPVSVPQSVCRPLHLHPLRGLPRYTPKPYTLNPNPHLKGL